MAACHPRDHLTIPLQLTIDLYNNPLAIGLYSLVTRLYLIEHTSIPLSAADVQHYDPTLSRGAILRALIRLVRSGWLIEHAHAGHKTRYTPGWGRVGGIPRPWSMDAPLLNRPRRHEVLRLSRRLFDICMGRLSTHQSSPARIERYVGEPLLGLADIGAYALALGGQPTETPALLRLGLARKGQACPVPADQHLLALASQRALDDASTPGLTAKGMRKLGWTPIRDTDQPANATAGTQPLFFVPKSMIGSLIAPLIGEVIGHATDPANASTSSGSHETGLSDDHQPITWTRRDHGSPGISPPNPPMPGVGGGDTPPSEPQAHETDAAHLLRSINVRPQVIAELADVPIERVQAAIAYAQAQPAVRDLAGWVVSVLRDSRDHGWTIPAPSLVGDGDAAGLRASVERVRAAGVAIAIGDEGEAIAPAPRECQDGGSPNSDAPSLFRVRPEELAGQLRQALRARSERDLWPVIAGLTCTVAGDILTLDCGTAAQLALVQARVRPLLGPALADLGWEPSSQVVVTLRAGVATTPVETPAEARPAWIAEAVWAGLPVVVRAALRGSVREGEGVRGATPALTQLLQTRFAAQVRAVLKEDGVGRTGSGDAPGTAAQACVLEERARERSAPRSLQLPVRRA